MADDLYAALIGEGAGDNGAVIANALRRRRQLGQLGVLTGDKVLTASGQDLSSSTDDYMKQLQQTRQDNSRQAQTRAYQEGQLKHMGASLDETKRNNTMDHVYQMLMAQAALERANRPPGGGKIPKLRQGDIKEMQDIGQVIGIVKGIESFMEKGGSFGTIKAGKIPLPGSRGLANTAAAMGFGTEETKASFNARQQWDLLYNIAERNRMFGATLTENEKKSWDAANPSGNMSDEQIKVALPIMRRVFEHRLNRKASGLMKEGYNAEAIADYADVPGINLPTSVGGAEGMAAPEAGGAPAAGATKPKRFKLVDGKFVAQ